MAELLRALGIAATCNILAIRMRFKEPQLQRPFRMPFFPLPAMIGFTANALLVGAMVYEDPYDSSIGVGVVLAIGIGTNVRSTLRVARPAAV